MSFDWTVFIHLGIISAALMLATFIRAKVRFFQRFLIPNALTAGFILLPLYNYVFPLVGLNSMTLEALTYHLLSVSFVAMSLRKAPKRKRDGRIFATSVAVLSQYAIQTSLGLILTFVMIRTFIPDLFHSFGWLMPLGFVLGPGQAFSIGEGWRVAGIEGAGSIGLTFAAVGFIVSSFGGVFLINYGIRHGWLANNRHEVAHTDAGPGVRPAGSKMPVGSRLTTDSDAIDTMTVNLGMVAGCYLVTYLFLQGMTGLLSLLGDLGRDLAINLWGISFVFASVVAMIVRNILRKAKVDHILDNGSLTRISGTSVDMTVAAAVGAISLVVVGQYWLPIVIIAAVAGIFVCISVPWMGSRLFANHRMHRTLILFGAMTGTLPTGLALLRVIDPDFETPVGSDYVYSSAIVFILVIPLVLAMNLPAYAVARNQPHLVWILLGLLAAYVIVGFVLYVVVAGVRRFKSPFRIWMPKGDVE